LDVINELNGRGIVGGTRKCRGTAGLKKNRGSGSGIESNLEKILKARTNIQFSGEKTGTEKAHFTQEGKTPEKTMGAKRRERKADAKKVRAGHRTE